MNKNAVILLADHNSEHIAWIKTVVNSVQSDNTILCANDANSIFEKVAESNPENQVGLIILELNLEGMSGIEILTKLKSGPKSRQIPVIIFTASKNKAEIANCYDLGANCFISKPSDEKSFKSLAERILNFWLKISYLPLKN